MLEKTWLLQESIIHPTAGFQVFVNKEPTFNFSMSSVDMYAVSLSWKFPSLPPSVMLLIDIAQKSTYSSSSAFVLSRRPSTTQPTSVPILRSYSPSAVLLSSSTVTPPTKIEPAVLSMIALVARRPKKRYEVFMSPELQLMKKLLFINLQIISFLIRHCF